MGERKKSGPDQNGVDGRVFNMILFIYTLYCIALLCVLQDRTYIKWQIFLVVVLVLAAWGVAKTSRFSFDTCAYIISTLIGITLVVIGIAVENIVNYIPIMFSFMILVCMIGNKKISYFFPISFLVLFAYHILVSGSFKLFDERHVPIGLVHIINVMIFSALATFWNRKRADNMKKMMGIIQETVEAERIKDDFIANISHELRTPLNTISGMSDMLLDEKLDINTREKIKYIQMSARSLTSVVGNILDFSELNNGHMVLEEEKYNIASTINDIVNTTIAKMQGKNIEMVVDCASDMPCELYGDEKKIRRAISNILDNAIKFTDEGYVLLKLGFRKEEYGINLLIEISDSGIGISEENLDKIFQSFNQVDSKRNKKVGGIGLGLSISKLLMESLGGIFSLKSKLGKGTTVKMVIPQKVIDDRWIARISDKERESLKLGLYVNLEEFVEQELRDAYQMTIIHMIEQMNVKSHICGSLNELKRRNEIEHFTHVFISIDEYVEDKKYFDLLSEQTNVIVVLKQQDEREVTNRNLKILYRPFYILPILSVILGTIRENMTGDLKPRRKFTSNAKALVIDDNKTNLLVAKGLLEKYGIAVTVAESGIEGLEVLEKKDFDLVFLDHMMPEMDGVETLKRIRNKGGMYFTQIPVVALTANAAAGSREKFIEYGFSDFLEKPIETSVLERVLLRMVSEKKIFYYEENNNENNSENDIENTNISSNDEIIDNLTEIESKDDVSQEKLVIGDIDVEKGIAYCGGFEGYKIILDATVDSMIQNETKLEELFDSEDWNNYTIMVHGIKSSLLAIGATKLSEIAKSLEYAGKSEDIQFIRENHKVLMQEFRRVLELIRNHPLINKPELKDDISNVTFDVISKEDFEKCIEDFENAIYDFDENKMEEILNYLSNYSYNGTPLVKKIVVLKKKVQASDYMSAGESLRKILGGK